MGLAPRIHSRERGLGHRARRHLEIPLLAGANGGGAFIIPYVLFTFTIGVALAAAEIAIGRHGRGSVVSALRRRAGSPLRCWGLSVLTAYVILSYYSVVGGWCFAYLSSR